MCVRILDSTYLKNSGLYHSAATRATYIIRQLPRVLKSQIIFFINIIIIKSKKLALE